MTRFFAQTLMVENSTSYVTPETCAHLADAFHAAFPDGHLTWAIENQAVTAAGMASVRAYIVDQCAAHGDRIALCGAFSSVRQATSAATAELASLLGTLKASTGETEPAMFAWAAPAAVLPTAIAAGVRVVAGQTWGQENVDGYSGEGSPNRPYYPSKNHFLVPAQSPENALDVVMMDTLASGYWESLHGRSTVHTVDAHTLTRMQSITRDYLERTVTDPEFTAVWSGCEVKWINDTSLSNPVIYQSGNYYARDRLVAWWQWLASEYDDLQAVSLQEFGAAWRDLHPYADGNRWRASVTSENPSDATQAVTWEFSPRQRVGIVTTAAGAQLVDLTNYSDATTEPTPMTTIDSDLDPGQSWSVPQVVAQKRSPVSTLPAGIARRSEGRA